MRTIAAYSFERRLEPTFVLFSKRNCAYYVAVRKKMLNALWSDFMFHKMKSSNFSHATLLLAAVIACTFVVLGNAYSSAHGYISPDSANYLRLAQRIVDGKGFYVPANGRIGPNEVWFAVWPSGYSVLIAAVSALSGVSVFLASKIANVLLLSGSLLLLYRFLGRDGLIAGTVLLSAGTLQVFSMTWSEAPFLMALIALCLVLAAVADGELRVNVGLIPVLTLLMVLPFAFRYVGAFIFAPVGIVVLHLLLGRRRCEGWQLLLATAIALALCAFYLWHNWLQTGYLTGVDRISAPESHATLIRTFLVAAIHEMTLPLIVWSPQSPKQSLVVFAWAALALLVLVRLIRSEKTPIETRNRLFAFYFGAFGGIYLLCIAILRWNSHFDEFSYRLLDPGFSLLSIGAILWLLGRYRQHTGWISCFLIATACLSISLHTYQIFSRNGFGSYIDQIDQAAARYADIPNEAIVVLGENELLYLRPSIQLARPNFRPYSSDDEEWSAFLGTLQPGVPIFVENGGGARVPGRYHQTVRDAVKGLPVDELTKISP